MCQAAKRRSRKTPTVLAADFTPASILAGGEGIVRFSIPTARNNERTQVLLSHDLSILDSEINIKISMRFVRYAGKGLLACRSNSVNDVRADNRRFPNLPTPRRTMRGNRWRSPVYCPTGYVCPTEHRNRQDILTKGVEELVHNSWWILEGSGSGTSPASHQKGTSESPTPPTLFGGGVASGVLRVKITR